MIKQFPRQISRLYTWSEKYVEIWASEGWLPASKYLKEYVPEQFWHQIRPLIEQELLKRGITVEF